jgi:hypothetical protein
VEEPFCGQPGDENVIESVTLTYDFFELVQ